MKKTLFFYLFLAIISCKKEKTTDPVNTPTNTAGITSITICGQVWMAKNLDVSTYRNGDPIPQVTDQNQWATITTGAWCYYNNDPSMDAIYGKLYNWYAVNDPRGLAPAGWHIPTDAEWTSLETCLGGTNLAGGKMKEAGTTHWMSPNTGATNSSAFTGLPGGFRNSGSPFGNVGYLGFWWSSTQNNPYGAFRCMLSNADSILQRGSLPERAGLSVRCIKN